MIITAFCSFFIKFSSEFFLINLFRVLIVIGHLGMEFVRAKTKRYFRMWKSICGRVCFLYMLINLWNIVTMLALGRMRLPWFNFTLLGYICPSHLRTTSQHVWRYLLLILQHLSFYKLLGINAILLTTIKLIIILWIILSRRAPYPFLPPWSRPATLPPSKPLIPYRIRVHTLRIPASRISTTSRSLPSLTRLPICPATLRACSSHLSISSLSRELVIIRATEGALKVGVALRPAVLVVQCRRRPLLPTYLLHLALAEQLGIFDQLVAEVRRLVAVDQGVAMHALLGEDGAYLQMQFALVAEALHLLGEQFLVFEGLEV